MKNSRIYLSPPHQNGEEQEALRKVLDSNWLAPVGPEIDAWEQELARYCGRQYCCLVNSGTAALHLALRILDIGPGSRVFTQSLTFAGGVNPILYQSGEPVFIDSEEESWNMDPQLLTEAIENAKANLEGGAIIPVHIYGSPARMKEILEIGKYYDLPVIEDAAEALGSRYGKHMAGSMGEISFLSFNGNKIITSSGGGALLTDRKDYYEKARYLSQQAREAAVHYEHHKLGYNYRLSNVLAALGRQQMMNLEERVQKRRENYERYRAYFMQLNVRGNFNIRFQLELEGGRSNRWLTVILIDPETNGGINREQLRLALEEENIESRPVWKPMHMQKLYQGYDFIDAGVSTELFEQGLCLPSGGQMTDEDFERIFGVVNQVFRR